MVGKPHRGEKFAKEKAAKWMLGVILASLV
jgi:hypothetical protein